MADEPLKRFSGGLLMTIGALIGGLGGLCTLGFVGSIFMSATRATYPGALSGSLIFSLLCLFVGAIPMSIGAGLFFLGRSLWRSAGPRGL